MFAEVPKARRFAGVFAHLGSEDPGMSVAQLLKALFGEVFQDGVTARMRCLVRLASVSIHV